MEEQTYIQPDTPEISKRESEPQRKASDKTLVFGILIVVLVFAGVFGYIYFVREPPTTIEGMHIANLNNELGADQGRVYRGHSFVNLDGFWYTQLSSPIGTKIYDMTFRFPPWELEGIVIKGKLDIEEFNKANNYSVTFNPSGNNFAHVALAIGDFNQHMMHVFEKMPIASCDRNETEACADRPVADCSSEGIVFYVNESSENEVVYDDNCIVVNGNGIELVKSVDWVLYNLYGILN